MEFDPFADYLGLGDLLDPVGNRQHHIINSGSRYRLGALGTSSLGDLLDCDIREMSRIEGQVAGTESSVRASDRYKPLPLNNDDISEMVALMRRILSSPRMATAVQGPAFPCPVGQPPRSPLYCAFCRQNGEMRRYYLSHSLKDRFGNVSCPVLRAYICPLCQATGDQAHTVKYCPFSDSQNPSSLPLAKALRAGRNCSGQKRFPIRD